MAARKQITITQVARAAGVSTQTVSRVINERPDVAPETRLRVQNVIEQLDYRPNVLARSLIHRRSHTIGVVAMSSGFYGPSTTLVGIEKMTRHLGYSLLLDFMHHPESDDVDRIINRLLSHQVDGILWAVPEVGQNRQWLQDQLHVLPVPVLFLTMEARPGLSVIAVDNYAGGRLATTHLLEQGYRRIGHIAGPLDWWEARQRKAGWEETLAAAGISEADRHWDAGDWSSASGSEAIRRLLEQHPDMEAVFAGNDQMALGVLQIACQKGIRVPHDLAVVGFDGLPEAAHYWPPLTTVDQGQEELGSMAVQTLVEIVKAQRQDNPPRPTAIQLQPRLVVRNSSAGVPARDDCCG